MGLFSLVGGLLGGGAAKKASRNAEQAQLQYLTQALGVQQQQQQQDRTDFTPYREVGASALGAQGNLVGINGPGVQGTAIQQLMQSPLYQSLYRNGLEANLQNASATGGIRGGNEVRGLADFGADTLSTTIQNQLQNLGGISGMGLQGTQAGSAAGGNLAAQIAQILGQQGQVRAGGILTRGGITNGMWQNAGSGLDDMIKQALSAFTGGGGIPSGGF